MWRTLWFVFLLSSPVYAVPVVPNFTQGSSTSRTETTTNITETIRTTDYGGFQYSVSGSGIQMDKNNSIRKRYRYNYNILPVIGLLFGNPVFANTSNTAAPQASASGSVSNFATQVLGGPMVENSYGNGIVCSGPQMSISPFAYSNLNIKRPMDYIYETPYYNQAVDDDGNLTNAGEILFYQENYSGNKDSLGLNVGVALTFNIPLDKRFQDACLKSATTQEKIQRQILSKERLNYELARLKNCGELKLAGIGYAKNSIYYKLCEDVIVSPKKGQVLPHSHKLKQ